MGKAVVAWKLSILAQEIRTLWPEYEPLAQHLLDIGRALTRGEWPRMRLWVMTPEEALQYLEELAEESAEEGGEDVLL